MAVKGYHQGNRKRAKAHGFLTRKKTAGGRNMLKRRMRKGRAQLAA